jgi:hypothetical protein
MNRRSSRDSSYYVFKISHPGNGTSLPAQIIDTGDARASFFVAVWSAPSRWEALIARDAAGAELETYRRR